MTPTLYEGTETEFKTNGLGRLSDMGKCLVTEERNGAFELECEYPLSGVHFSEIKYGRIIFATPSYGADPEPFEIYKITKPLNGISTIYARHISYRLSLTPVLPFSATSCPEALSGLKSNAVESCPFTFYTDKTTSAAFSVTVPSSIRSLLGGQQGSILDVFGTGEYKWNRFKVSFLKARGEKKSVKIAYGKNLTDLKQEENIENTVTGIVPYWKGSGDSGKIVTLGQKVVQSDYADSYPYHRTIPVDFSSKWQQEPTEDQLLQAAQAYIKANDIGVPKVSIDVSFVNLADTVEYAGLADEDIRLCDTVTVAYEKLGVTATAKVTKTVWNVLLGRYDSISLGDAARTLASTLADRTRQLQSGIASAASMSARNDDLLSQKIAEQARADKAAWESYADKQTEGLITTYFTDSVPVDGLDVGDLWFNTAENNSVSRWNGNKWESVRDTDIAEALKQAGDAQSTADEKILTFAQKEAPTQGMSTGDLWIDTNDQNLLYRFDGSKWQPYRDAMIAKSLEDAKKYTDDAKDAWSKELENQADKMIQTFFQEEKPEDPQFGDLWFNTKDNNSVSRWNGTDWESVRDKQIAEAVKAAGEAKDTADKKIVTYAQDEEPEGAEKGDLWIDTNDQNQLYRFNGTSWESYRDQLIAANLEEANKHADDAVKTAQEAWSKELNEKTNGLITTYYQENAPTENLDVGDLWFNTKDNKSISRWNGTEWESVRDDGIAEAIKAAGDAQATADGKINTFAQDGQPIAASVGDLWIDTDNDNCLYRWSGSEWVPYRDALIEKYKEGLAGDIEKAKTAASDMIKDMKNLTGYAFIHYNSAGNPYEFIVANNTNLSKATKVWRWNQSGLAFSSTGYNGNYSAVALTSDGKIVADRILTGTLTANIIKAGILSDKAGRNSWNLVTGAFSSIGTITNYYKNGIIGKYVFTRITDGAVEIGTCDDAKGTNANVIGSVTISKYYTDNVGYNSFGISSNNPVFISSDNVVGIVGGGQLYDGGAIVSSGYVEFNRTGVHGLLHDEEGYSGILKFGDGQIEVRDGIIIESLNTYGGSGSTNTGGDDDGGDIIVEG